MATTTRRNLLRIGTTAVAYVAGATIVTGGTVLTSRAEAAAPTAARAHWDTAFAKMLSACAADDAINARYNAATDADQEMLEAEYEQLGEARYEATWALFAIPVPDHDALLWKSEYLFGECTDRAASSPCWASHVVAAYMEDARRLLAQGFA